MMRRWLSLLVVLALLTPALPGAAAEPIAPAAAAVAPFRLVFVADTHVRTGSSNAAVGRVLGDIARLNPPAELLIHGGDITEVGAAGEHVLYWSMISELGRDAYHVPGTHDVRWSGAGKARFRHWFGEPRRSLDYGGVQLILLDTTLSMAPRGHLEPEQLAWLAAELAGLEPAKPVFVFMHHPIDHQGGRWLTDDAALLGLLGEHNVRAVFAAHVHDQRHWVQNGIDFFTVRPAIDDGYLIVDVGAESVSVQGRFVGRTPTTPTTVALTPPAGRPRLEVRAPADDQTLPAGALRLDIAVVGRDLPQPLTALSARLGDGPVMPLQEQAGAWQATLDLAGLPPGRHVLDMRGEDAAGGLWSARQSFWLPQAAASADAALAWRFRAAGSLQTTPLAVGDTVYVGAGDGRLYAVDAATGHERWSVQTEGPVLAAPAAVGDRVLFGSDDGHLYAVAAATGRILWRRDLGAPVTGSPLAAGERVFAGAADGRLHALALADGEPLWVYQTGDLIRGRPAYGAGVVYTGSWDGSIHAVAADTGARVWRQQLANSLYFAPAGGELLFDRGRLIATTAPDGAAGGWGVWALDAFDGQVLWRRQLAAGFAAPVALGEHIVVATNTGEVVALDRATGLSRWWVDTGYAVLGASPAPFGGEVALAGVEGRLLLVTPPAAAGEQAAAPAAARTAAVLGSGWLLRPVAAAPAADTIYAASTDGYLYAVAVAPTRPAPPSLFTDLTAHWAAEAAEILAERGLVEGFPDGSFRPAATVTRGQLAALLVRLLPAKDEQEPLETAFVDLEGHWARAAVVYLERRGLAGGYDSPAGRVFRPDQDVSRAEAAALLARALGLPAPDPDRQTALGDIAGHWGADLIMALEQAGLVEGARGADGAVFRPDDTLSRAEVAALLLRVLKRGG